MYFTGFADEAGKSLATQIAATKELGWKYIETRMIGEKTLASLSEAEFEDVCRMLTESGIRFNCYGSGIANWAKHPRKDEDFKASKTELINAIPRMHKLGIKMLRGMSFLTPDDEDPDSPELENIIFGKVAELVAICENEGIVYGHENCMNYGGLSHLHTLKMLDRIKSPALRLIFDTGNPVFNYRHIGQAPYPLQSSWEFYRNVREFIDYVHIKDGTVMVQPDGTTRPPCQFCYPGEGCGDVPAIVKDLLKIGYDGGFSIEPHVANVFHEADKSQPIDSVMYDSYVEYGRRFEKLVADIKGDRR